MIVKEEKMRRIATLEEELKKLKEEIWYERRNRFKWHS
jgi:hypothetical protein